MGFFKLTIRDVPLDGKTVLVRCDYNVPLTTDGEISDDFRIKASLPTIRYLLDRNCRVVIISHLGRPEGKDESLSLEKVSVRLSELLGQKVEFVDETIGAKVKLAVKNLPLRSVILLENLRFHKEEEANDESFAKKLAEDTGAKYFVQDGFGVVHREHASTSAITLYLPSVAGLLVEKEYKSITDAIKSPEHPLVSVLGGAKVSDKILVIKNLIQISDRIIIGGAMANTFLAYKGVRVGSSNIEADQFGLIEEIYKLTADKGEDFIVLPIDVAVAVLPSETSPRHVLGIGDIDSESKAVDIGDRSIEEMVGIVKDAKTVIWNGTLGMAEYPSFAHGSARLALALATQECTKSIIGGGDTADFVLNWDGQGGKSFTLVSTGGGASLDLMAGKILPGIDSLLDAKD